MEKYLVASPIMPTLLNHAHPQNFHENKLIVMKFCYNVLDRSPSHYLWKKWNNSIVNFRWHVHLKVGVTLQIGGCI